MGLEGGFAALGLCILSSLHSSGGSCGRTQSSLSYLGIWGVSSLELSL